MIGAGVGDEEEVLMDGCDRAAADAEGGIEGGDHNAGLEAPDRGPFDVMPSHFQALLPARLRPRLPVLLFLDGREQSRPFNRGWTADVVDWDSRAWK